MIETARRKGFSAYIGEGKNCWPAVHRVDVARLFRLAFEMASPGSRLHGVAEEGIPMMMIAETIVGMIMIIAVIKKIIAMARTMVKDVIINNNITSAHL